MAGKAIGMNGGISRGVLGDGVFHLIKWFSLVIGVFFLAMGSLPFVWSWQSGYWQQVEGRIITTTPATGAGMFQHTGVIYSYSHGGRGHQGERIEFGLGDQRFLLQESAEGISRRYPAGKLVTVFVNPDDPSEAVLERAPSLGGSMAWITLGFLFIVSGWYPVFFMHVHKYSPHAFGAPRERQRR